jgi:serine/threonine-protein kinase
MSETTESAAGSSQEPTARPPLPPPPRPLPPAKPGEAAPAAVGRFRIDGELGRGGMGVVYRGHDPALDRAVAVKVLHAGLSADPALGRRFLEEARLAGRLQHPGVVPVHEIGRIDDGLLFFAMKLVQGRTFADLLRERPDPAHELPRFLLIFEQVCQAVGFAHAHGVLHRDLKPSNVMVGEFGEVQVMDWGLAKVLASGAPAPPAPSPPGEAPSPRAGGAGATAVGEVLGTPAYMPPEQARGEVDALDARCDVFSLGAVLCEVLTGRPPYPEGGLEALVRAATADLADAFARLDACGADAELVRLARACLAAEPPGRPPDAAAVAAAVRAYLNGVQERLRAAELARAEARAKAAGERKRRRLFGWLAAAVAAAVLAGAGGAVWVLWEHAGRVEERARADAEQARAQQEAADRRARESQELAAALQAAAGLRAKARAAGPDDRTSWTEALAAARQVKGLLAGADLDDDVRRPAEDLVADVEREARDRRLLARLDEARLQAAAPSGRGPIDYAGAAASYAAAFRDDGLDVAALGPDEAADRINRREIRGELLAALADWARTTRDAGLREKLFRVVGAADPDPDSFRNRWNAAVQKGDREALARLAGEPAVGELPPAELPSLARELAGAGAVPEAIALLRAAQQQRPDDFWVNFELAHQLAEQKQPTWDFEANRPASRPPSSQLGAENKPAWDEVIRFYTAAAALRPGSAFVHNNLGTALRNEGRLDEAIAEYRKALDLKPDYAAPHYNLGNALLNKGRPDEAIAEYRKALDLQPDNALAHGTLASTLAVIKGRQDEAIAEYRKALDLQPDFAEARCGLGLALSAKGRFDDAIAEFRKALDLQPDYATAHCGLGVALMARGRFAEALVSLRRGQELGSKQPGWRLPSAQWVAMDERLLQDDLLLPALLRGEAEPADAEARAQLASFCRQFKRRYALAARLWSEAFADRPALKDDLASGNRYNAACSAALAGCGQGEDAAGLTEADRARLRRQALDWLREELAARRKQLADADAAGRSAAQAKLKRWKEDADLAGVRDAAGLAKLPEAEQAEWKKLWADVTASLNDGGGPG